VLRGGPWNSDEEEGEGEEEDGRMEQNKEGALFVMLLPTLLFLQTLLKRLQVCSLFNISCSLGSTFT
jgi:hypothetical protein